MPSTRRRFDCSASRAASELVSFSGDTIREVSLVPWA
jgi:hypothetical protein